MMRALGLVVLFLIACAGVLLVYVRQHGFSARAKPSAVETFLARKVRSLATPAGVKAMPNPLDPTPLNVAEARDHFADHCAICHANDGSGKTMINEGLYPPAPDLRDRDTQQLSDGELLSIIKNGIRMTGMASYGKVHKDDEIWSLVAFVERLQKMTPEQYKQMGQAAAATR